MWTIEGLASGPGLMRPRAIGERRFIEMKGGRLLSALLLVATAAVHSSQAEAQAFAYVSNLGGNTVSVIDTATNSVIATVPVGFAPTGVAVHPAGTFVYVANRTANTVSVIDTAANSVTATIPVGVEPTGVAVNPAGTFVYVANQFSNTVSVIDTATNTVVDTVSVGTDPHGVAVHRTGAFVYVSNQLSNSVSVIDTATNSVMATVPVGVGPSGVVAHPDGTRVYAVNRNSDSVSVIDTATNTVIATVSVGFAPEAASVLPGGTRLYVTNGFGNSVTVIDTATNSVIATVPVGGLAIGVAAHPDGTRVYVAILFTDTVSVIDVGTSSVIDTISVGSEPYALGQFIGPAAAVEILPHTFNVLRGLLLSGGLPDLFDSDDSRLVVRTAVFAPSIDPPVQIEVAGTSPTETPSELRFRFEGMASRNLIERRISLYNYVTQSYEELHVGFAATSDEVIEIVVTSDPSRFVEPGTRQVKSLMTWKAAAFSFFTGWNVGIDQSVWTIVP
ncbi:MAG: YncE family protein [Armatimonadetes bacterium]|nr:YncE family protein [Armatimonadota bacterium]